LYHIDNKANTVAVEKDEPEVAGYTSKECEGKVPFGTTYPRVNIGSEQQSRLVPELSSAARLS